jgi:hypothetical protein
MADTGTLRRVFADFLGDEQFRKFVRQYLQNGRMRFWQEREWNRFVATRPEFEDAKSELPTALRVCWRHESELQPDDVKVLDENLDYAESYLRAKRVDFPCLGLNSVISGVVDSNEGQGVWFCPECRIAEEKWREGNDVLCKEPPRDWLVGPTTFREYCIDQFFSDLGYVPQSTLARFEEQESEVATKLKPGDELWSWHRKGGPFSSSGGLAILRGEDVVEWWRTWVS